MQIDQILVRPQQDKVVLQYSDIVGRSNGLSYALSGSPAAQALIQECQTKLPTGAENPARTEIEQEIAELEYRLSQLKSSIGVS